MKKFIIFFLLLTGFISANAVSQEMNTADAEKKDIGFDYGSIDSNIYKNSFFSLTASIPEKWFVQSKETTQMLIEKGKDIVAGDDENMKAVIRASDVNTAYLLTVFQNELGTPVEYNASFMIMAENLKLYPGIKTGKDYLFSARRLMNQSQIKYDHLDEDFEKRSIGGKEFYLMNALIKYAGLDIKQTYYCTTLNGFALNVIISYVTDEQKAILDKFVSSIRFNK
ncbi:MAG: hypothetical protein JW982_16820 [Spirochaetes bacterium]|nr:hypothetical protein [Spirochaetota bacterium]